MSVSMVVVTGGGRGIGRAVCERFAAGGAQIVAASRSTQDLQETSRLVSAAGGKCHALPTDVCEPEEVNALIETAAGKFGRIDVLVNCAGVAPLAKIEDLDPALFDTVMAVNVRAVYEACRAVWPVMKAHGEGVIVNMSSMASVDPFPGFAAYGAAKAWVTLWTKALAEEGRSCGIRVFAVAPGAVETRMLRDAFPDFPAEETLKPREVAEMVYALAQPACRYATGETVFVKK